MKNESIQSGKDYGLVFRNYLMQDVLDKISLSNYAENFILKGGYLLFLLYEKNYPRATYDLDFSGQQISNIREDLLDVFFEILSNINIIFSIFSQYLRKNLQNCQKNVNIS